MSNRLKNLIKESLKGHFRDPFNGDIHEGLIKTINSEDAGEILYNKFKNLNGFSINITKNDIMIGFKPKYIESNLSNYSGVVEDQNIIEILKLANNLGYFPSNVIFSSKDGDYNDSEKYSTSNIRQILSQEPEYIEFILEKKFDDVVNPPQNIYHITNRKWIEQIKKIGLKPKSLNKNSTHSERIYFSISKEYSNTLWDKLKLYFGKDQGVLLTIDTNGLDTTFYNDPNFDKKGVYTYQNIPSKNIIKIENIIE